MQTEPATEADRTAAIRLKAPWIIVSCSVRDDYCVEVTFSDGTKGIVDLKTDVFSEGAGVLAGLRDPFVFARVGIVGGALTWPGGIDLAPDAMYDDIKSSAGQV
ncbi:MAG TPA: DUF2442 domain-containing protein [Dissulfurispiraceae bacterium]|nr:DUF2442 domain-containing protein [Dissulfurispiraceae bacterium]